MNGGLGRFLATLQVSRDVLQHHNGIIHHHTDRDGQGGHRDDVQGVARGVKVNQGSKQRYRDRKHDDERRPPSSKEYIDDKHYHQKGDDDRLFQRVEGVENVRRAIDHSRDLHIGRKCRSDGLELLLDAPDDVDGVCAGLLLDGDHRGSLTVGERFLRLLLKTVDDGGDIPKINCLAVPCADNYVQQFGRILELLLDTKGKGLGSDVDASGRHVTVLCGDDLGYSRNAQAVGFQFVRVAVNVDFPFRGTGNADSTHTLDTSERGDKFVVKDLVQTHNALVRLGGKDQHRHVIRAELEEHRNGRSVRQGRVDKVQLVSDVVAGLVDVGAIFKLQDDYGDVFL